MKRFVDLEESPFGFLAIDSRFIILHLNKTAENFDPRITLGGNVEKIFSAESVAQIAEIFARSKATSKFVVSLDQGMVFNAAAWPSSSTSIDEVIIQLVPEKKNSVSQSNLELLGQAVEQAWESICITDAELDLPGPNFVYVNQGYSHLTGWTQAEVLGKTPRIHQGPLTDRKTLDRLKHNLKNGENFHGDTVNYKKDGKPFWLEWKISPVKSADGTVTNFIAFQRDVTELKAAQQRIRDFHSVLAHELRAPLTSIKGSLRLLEGFGYDPNSKKGKELIHIGIESTDRLIRLISELLDLGKIESGESNLKLQNLEVNELVETASDNLTNYRADDKVKIHTQGIDARVVADKDRIIQVLINLISNAMKFSPSGGTVDVSVAKCDTGVLRFSVKDTGPGISLENQQKLFTKFQQLMPEDGIPRQGSGLGLTIAKAIIEQHSGSIGLDSKVGSGSTFWFELPQADLSSDQERHSGSPTILLVEDDIQLATLIKHYLARDGYVVNAVNTIAAARMALFDLRHDACIIDVKLPDGSGLNLLEEMRTRPATRSIPVLMTSASAQEIFSLGSPVEVDWLPKPFELNALGLSIERIFGKATRRVLLCENAEGFWQSLPDLLGKENVELLDCSDDTSTIKFRAATLQKYVGLKFDGSDRAEKNLNRMTTEIVNPTIIIICCSGNLSESAQESLTGLITQQISTAQLSDRQFLDKIEECLGTKEMTVHA
ncbi:MAG: PAS domain S-box protein [Leptolyngbya sp.]|nr:PAS domain S-box protein [Candidatus Melainabacteria bacterium]